MQPTVSAASFVASMHNPHGRLRGTLEALILAADEAEPMLPGHNQTLGILADELDTSTWLCNNVVPVCCVLRWCSFH